MKKLLVLTLCLLVMISLATPALAQTSDEILADASGEAVQVISSSAFTIWAVIVGGLVALAGIITVTALRLVYKSTPEWAHSGMIAVADKAVSALQALADKTTISADDQVTLAIRKAFDSFVDSLVTPLDNDPTPPTDSKPIQ